MPYATTDKQLAEIRKRDADYKSLAPHWQAQQDRRYLLELIDTLIAERTDHGHLPMRAS